MGALCVYCGAKLEQDHLKDLWTCPLCEETATGQELMEADPAPLLHGTKCEECDGEGFIEVTTEQGHPYGDTFAIERITEVEDCEECLGKGAFMDETTCVVCGLAVADGWSQSGWEVHPECHDLDEKVPGPS